MQCFSVDEAKFRMAVEKRKSVSTGNSNSEALNHATPSKSTGGFTQPAKTSTKPSETDVLVSPKSLSINHAEDGVWSMPTNNKAFNYSCFSCNKSLVESKALSRVLRCKRRKTTTTAIIFAEQFDIDGFAR